MKKSRLLSEGLAIGIVLLFIGTCIIPTIAHDSLLQDSMLIRHPLDPTNYWNERQKLLASDGMPGDAFGWSVSVSDDTALVGAPYDSNDTGAVYVFIRSGATWTQQDKLLASDGAVDSYFGNSVCLCGDFALIGASGDDGKGAAYVFVRTGTIWAQQAKLVASDGSSSDLFGYSLSLFYNGEYNALIGAPGDCDNGAYSGSAYVFTRSYTNWTWSQQAKLLASDGTAWDSFGCSVSLSDDAALIGADGSAYIFTNTGVNWIQQGEFLPSDDPFHNNYFGTSVSLFEEFALIGSPYDDENGFNSGSAYVFIRIGDIWTQQQKILAADSKPRSHFGSSVYLDETTAIIGAPDDDDNGPGSGSAYVFTLNGGAWTQQNKLLASDGAAESRFGQSVSLDGATALVGAPMDGDAKGSAYVFIKSKNQPPIADFLWTPQNPTPNHNITCDASKSTDPDGTIITYDWDWNNDGTYDESHPTPLAVHSWLNPGNYPVKLRVTDNQSAPGTKTLTVDVTVDGRNHPPTSPTITGPTTGEVKINTNYNFTSVDSDNDDILYFIDWGDGTNSSWEGPYLSGEIFGESHTWSKRGIYMITAEAKDIHGNESGWGTLKIMMPFSYGKPFQSYLERLFERFPHVFPILRYLLEY